MKVTKIIAMFGIAIGLCAALAARTDAQCGVSLNHNQVTFRAGALPTTVLPTIAERSTVKDSPFEKEEDATIVGLWDVKFIVDGQVVDEGFDQYHSDGLEILNDSVPPITGNVCLGVYAKTGASTIKLRHPSWIYDATNTIVIGRATILEKVTLDRFARSFKGTFTIQFRDLAGNQLAPDLSGQLRGDRITPD
jgi:hypothetical protein